MSELFIKVQEIVHKEYNSNAHFSRLDWPVQVWIIYMCAVFQTELDNIERN